MSSLIQTEVTVLSVDGTRQYSMKDESPIVIECLCYIMMLRCVEVEFRTKKVDTCRRSQI